MTLQNENAKLDYHVNAGIDEVIDKCLHGRLFVLETGECEDDAENDLNEVGQGEEETADEFVDVPALSLPPVASVSEEATQHCYDLGYPYVVHRILGQTA